MSSTLALSIPAMLILIIPTLIGVYFNKKENKPIKHHILIGVIFAAVAFVYMTVVLYATNAIRNFTTLLSWLFPILLAFLVVLSIKNFRNLKSALAVLVLVSISVITLFTNIFRPIQYMVYAENVDEYQTATDATIDLANYLNNSKEFELDNPEIRKVGDEEVTIYHISAKNNSTEYIPGYILVRETGEIEFMPKRMYFDESYGGGRNTLRIVRNRYPFIYLGECKFDIDNNYNPNAVFVYREHLFSSNGKDYGIITVNLNDGSISRYTADAIPSWIDFKSTYPR